jgi:hypothetical protein
MCSVLTVAEDNGRQAGASDARAGRPRAPSPVSGSFAPIYDDAYSRAYAAGAPAAGKRARASGALLGLGAAPTGGEAGTTTQPALKALLG